jgi:hypothetical protein
MGFAVRARGLDPLSERAHRLSIRCHLAVGSVSVARESGRHLRRTLDEASIAPARETSLLLDKLDA